MFNRLLKQLEPYRQQLTLVVCCNILASIFTIASIPALIPFFSLLFGSDFAGPQSIVTHTPPAPVRWLDTKSLEEHLRYFLLIWKQAYGQFGALLRVCGIILGIFFFKNLFRYLSMYFLVPVRLGLVRDLRQRLLDKLLTLPLSYYTEERKGDLVARVTHDVTEVEWSMIGMIEALVREPILVFGSLFFMLWISPALTLFVLVLIICTGAIIGSLGKNLRKESGTAQQKMGGLMSILDETLSGIRVIKGFGAEAFQSSRFEAENNWYARVLMRIMRRKDLASPLSEFLGIAIVCILLLYGSQKVFSGSMSAELFFAFLYAFFNVIEPSKSFTNAMYNVRKGQGALDRIEEVLHTSPHITEEPMAPVLGPLQHHIAFEGVQFAYNQSHGPTLQDISFEIRKGEVVALVGPSGAGKSTIADLLTRFYDVQAGHIRIDGHEIKSVTLASLRNKFGIVGQDAILFHDTVRANLTLGSKAFTEAQIKAALLQANAWDFVSALDQGMDTIVGDRGLKLSGGQRQRLTIARALLRNPEVLILDEATSALDSESEQLVQQALDLLLKNRTALVIAHRLSTVMHADKIIVLEAGRIIAQGTHKQLLESNALYRRLVELQSL